MVEVTGEGFVKVRGHVARGYQVWVLALGA